MGVGLRILPRNFGAVSTERIVPVKVTNCTCCVSAVVGKRRVLRVLTSPILDSIPAFIGGPLALLL